jgi:hypothetical protein
MALSAQPESGGAQWCTLVGVTWAAFPGSLVVRPPHDPATPERDHSPLVVWRSSRSSVRPRRLVDGGPPPVALHRPRKQRPVRQYMRSLFGDHNGSAPELLWVALQ